MTTVPRRGSADYLSRTLQTLMEELPLDASDPLYGRVRVIVMNNRPGNHSVFYKVGILSAQQGPKQAGPQAVALQVYSASLAPMRFLHHAVIKPHSPTLYYLHHSTVDKQADAVRNDAVVYSPAPWC